MGSCSPSDDKMAPLSQQRMISGAGAREEQGLRNGSLGGNWKELWWPVLFRVTAHNSSGIVWGFRELAGHGGAVMAVVPPPRPVPGLFFQKRGWMWSHQYDPWSNWGAASGCSVAGCCNWQVLENRYVNVKMFLSKCAMLCSRAQHCIATLPRETHL